MDRPVKSLNPLLRMATLAGVETAVKLHIRRGDDLDARDGGGATPMMLAAGRKRKGVLTLLLAAGANPTLLDPEGRSALAYAEKAGCAECVALLRNAIEALRIVEDLPPVIQVSNEVECETNASLEAMLPSLPSLPEAMKSGQAEGEGGLESAGRAQEEEVAPVAPDIAPASPDKSLGAVPKPANEPAALVADAVIEVFGFDDGEGGLGFGDWEAEPDTVVPVGDETVVVNARAIHEAIGRHEAIDTDEDWNDVDAFLPERALPLIREDGEDGAVRALLLRALREGSVPEVDLIEVCRAVAGSRNEEAERLLTLVLGELGAGIDEREESGEPSFQGWPTVEEERQISEALEFAEDLASGRASPMRLYVRGFRGELLGAEEEVALSREMEEAGWEALDALAHWPVGLAAVVEAAAQVARGEANAESFSFGPDPSEDEESEDEESENDSGSDDESADPVIELDSCAEAFVAAIRAIEACGTVSPERVRAALRAAGLARGFMLELAERAGEDPGGKAFASAVRRQSAARERMILSNLRLAYSVAQKYRWSGEPLDDLVQEANLGLMKAVERYDWRKGFRFSTYATWWIRQQITRGIADKARLVRVPVHMHEKARRVLRERDEIEAKTGHQEGLEETARRMAIPLWKLHRILDVLKDPISLDEPLGDSALPVGEFLEGAKSDDPAAVVEAASLRATLLKMVAEFDQRSAQVLALRFGLWDEDAMTLEEVGRRFEVTRERIRQIESQALRKLSHPTRRDVLAVYMGGGFAPKVAAAGAKPGRGVTDQSSPIAHPKSPATCSSSMELSASTASANSQVASPSRDRPEAPASQEDRKSVRDSAVLSRLLEEARGLGLPIDDRRAEGGSLVVTLPRVLDSDARRLARKMTAAGVTLLFGSTSLK